MIIEFPVGDDANLVEYELTRPTMSVDPEAAGVVTVWVRPGVFRLAGPRPVLTKIVEERWANLPPMPPARMIVAE